MKENNTTEIKEPEEKETAAPEEKAELVNAVKDEYGIISKDTKIQR